MKWYWRSLYQVRYRGGLAQHNARMCRGRPSDDAHHHHQYPCHHHHHHHHYRYLCHHRHHLVIIGPSMWPWIIEKKPHHRGAPRAWQGGDLHIVFYLSVFLISCFVFFPRRKIISDPWNMTKDELSKNYNAFQSKLCCNNVAFFFNLCSFYTKPFTFEALREQADLCLLRVLRLPVQVILFACDREGKNTFKN